MKFQRLKIEGFRGISKLDIKELSQINLFIGKNNCGKTALLEAIFLNIGCSNPELILKIDLFRNIFHNQRDDFRFIFRNLDYANKLKIVGYLINPSQDRELVIEPSKSKRQREEISTIKSDELANASSSDYSIMKDVDLLKFNFKISSEKQVQTFSSEILFRDNKSVFKIDSRYKEVLNGSFLNKRSIFLQLYEKIDQLLINKQVKPIITILKKMEPSIESISLGANNMVYMEVGLERLVPLNIMGDGVVHLVSILTHIATAREGIILIDEMENGLHFASLELLWRGIFEASQLYNVQLFITTHSYECVEALVKISQENLFEKDQYNIHVYRLEKKPEEIDYQMFDQDSVGHFIDKNWELR
ncbi:ATP/GTP phosphatase [subsurface metagenome]